MTATGAPHQRTSEPFEPDVYRPVSTSSDELGFTRRPPVHWLSPSMLASTAGQVVISSVFGEFLDKRELQGSFPARVHDERPHAADDTDVWFDYVADVGDGFNPTYTVAYLLGQDHLEVAGERLPRGRFLVMGGDEIYPTPSTSLYADKMKGPYKAAMPQPPPEGSPRMYALPGNHDWYDGLSSFMRLFAKGGRDNIGGWTNEQDRSYFAIRLPHRWWLLAIDTQFGAYIDDPQLAYFREVVTHIEKGDRVIVCPPNPSWVEATEDPDAYNAMDYFVRTVLKPTGATIKVMLSGDLHHYARYENPKRQLIHCGGGGAYLYPTHRMPEHITVPPPSDN
ncbi:MAG TPA: metallophosphoesterase, partial [Micromonosporaceae bacterium]|nr:metallophosphoesterase [Micromonosporaceae bacterium]